MCHIVQWATLLPKQFYMYMYFLSCKIVLVAMYSLVVKDKSNGILMLIEAGEIKLMWRMKLCTIKLVKMSATP